MLEAITAELRGIGIEARIVRSWGGAGDKAVIFPFEVPNGPFRGNALQVGLSFQESAYPEYPPHFIHIRGLQAARLTKHSEHEFEDAQWWTFSVPPSDFWDGLEPSQKNMHTYIWRHLIRVLEQL